MGIRRVSATGALIAILMAGFCNAQEAPVQPPNPCETNERFSDFDFWVGSWIVYDMEGNRAGENLVTKTEQGCLIREHWTSASGNTGFSMNFYDTQAQAWRQVWISRGLQIDYTGGLNEAGQMVLNGYATYMGRGLSTEFRGTWTPQEDGSVIQHFEQVDPESGQWGDWFTGRYVRVEDDARSGQD